MARFARCNGNGMEMSNTAQKSALIAQQRRWSRAKPRRDPHVPRMLGKSERARAGLNGPERSCGDNWGSFWEEERRGSRTCALTKRNAKTRQGTAPTAYGHRHRVILWVFAVFPRSHENPNSPQASCIELIRALETIAAHPSGAAHRLVHENIQINGPQLNLQSFR